MQIAIDFDGTIVKHAYPKVGDPVPSALETIRELRRAGHQIIIFTMRSGSGLQEAREYMISNGIQCYGYNENKSQVHWTSSPKVYAHIYIDDAALGCPLIKKDGERPFVNWEEVRRQLIERGFLEG